MAKNKKSKSKVTLPKPIQLSGGRQVTPTGIVLNKKGKKEVR